MTREEAIKIIVFVRNNTLDFKLDKALEMAIKALETLEEFEKAQIITGGRLNGRAYAYKCGLEDGKRKALEQEPKTGHWIEHPHEAGINWEFSRYECSECHVWEDDDSDYCPNCGAKMVEPEESEE